MQADQVKVEPRLSSISCSGDRQECPPNCKQSSTQTGTLLIVWMLRWAPLYTIGAIINNNACTVASLQQLSDPNHASLLVTPTWWMHQRKLVLMPVCAASEDAQRQPCCVGQRRVRRRGQGASRLAMSASQVWLGQASPRASHRPSSPGEPLICSLLVTLWGPDATQCCRGYGTIEALVTARLLLYTGEIRCRACAMRPS